MKTKESIRAYNKKYYKKNQKKLRKYAREHHKKWYQKIRKEIFELLGDRCECCGETEKGFLCIDHRYNDGAKERRRGSGAGFVLGRRLIKKTADLSRYRILCYNCNMGRQYSGNNGKCPHELKET